MHGLVNRSIQCFLRDTYGLALWAAVAADAGLEAQGFEAMMSYDDALTDAVIDAAARRLVKPREALLEDLGIYLAGREPLRRLLRFGGVDYADFLLSLDELPDRVRLAVPEVDMADLSMIATGPGRYTLLCRGGHPGYAAVFAGVLRAMADDFGALALIEAGAAQGLTDTVTIELLEAQFASGRHFDLARPGRG
ncbi:heme NO-binding domain-containing protein [Defluviimonas salinarum]|uniref:Heme NO-binding domain-containing protein n=1 Tax=Defluviimonas salinarum TaxID=2992147 RepID=A0ABT3J2Z8_9RHOB|nr:heme NO-binding domain-containing protein [Defluviimonas salinarum]MCW3781794.1 heme NO-binding domain-containing protein [Defluviimonas salinarum]